MKPKEAARAKNFMKNFQPTEAEIENQIRHFQNSVADAPCFCGAEIIFERLTEDELNAAIRAGVVQIMFYEYVGMTGDQIALHFGFVGHLVCALRAKTKDVLNCSVIQYKGE